MASGRTVLQPAENGSEGNKRTPCPLYGCKRVYTDVRSLESHIRDHAIPAQSLPGKVLLCSTVGCSASFPNMQKLMEHMRHHHKPNIFFLCESCRTKLRSYRGLLTHLHTCSKVPRGKPKASEPMPPQTAAATNSHMPPTPMDQSPSHLDSVSTPQHGSQIPLPYGSFPTAVLQPDSAAPPLLGSPILSHPEMSSPQLASQHLLDEGNQPPPRNGAPYLPLSLNLDGPAASADLPDTQDQNERPARSPEPVHPPPGSAPRSPLVYSAVWKKNQGVAYSRRILWEHTKGRYTCVQCGQTATNRKEMTQHINIYHNSNKPAEDTGSSATNT